MPSAHFSPVHNSSGETRNWNTTWLKLLPSVDTVLPLNSSHARKAPSRPPSSASSKAYSITAATTGTPRQHIARIVATSRDRAPPEASLFLGTPTHTHLARHLT